MTADSSAPTPNHRVRRRNITLAIAAGIVLIVVLVAGVLVGVQGLGGANAGGSDGGAGSSGAGSGGSSETARPQPSEPAAAAPVITGPNPQSCDQLYSPRMLKILQDGTETPPASPTPMDASTSPAILALMKDLPALNCDWGTGQTFIFTDVLQVTPEQSAAAVAALKAEKYSCYAETQGTRCVKDVDGIGPAGESHFLRGNIWLSTFWQNWPQPGYTNDMVATLW